MIIRGIEEHDLRAALDVANYAYKGNLSFKEEPEPIQGSHYQSWKVQLGVMDEDGPGRGCLPGYPCAVCHHALRNFLCAIFERAPRAWAETAFGTYNGREDFVFRYRGVGRAIVRSLSWYNYFSEESCNCSRFPGTKELIPDPCLGEYAMHPDREIYAGLEHG